jgi:hypothetical protein
MIFPTESLRALRHYLGTQMQAGGLSEREAFRQALAADPDDFASLTHLFEHAMTARRFAEAERLGWELLRTAPASPHSYLLLTTVLEKRYTRSKLPMQCMLLGLEMMLCDKEALDEFDFEELLADDILGLIAGLAKRDALQVVLNGLRQMVDGAGPGPAELAPYRHILALRAAGARPIERAQVDAILSGASHYAPLLRGVLKEYAEGELQDEVPLVERAIGLLGEMGDPATIRDLVGFFPDDELVNPAMWAFWRISSRRPREAFDEVLQLIPNAEPLERFVAAQFLVHLPHMSGQVEALASLLEDIEDVPRFQRSGILSTVLNGIYVLDGADSPTGAELEQRYARLLTKKVRKQVQDMRELRRKTGPEEPPPFETTIYDICCTGRS